MDLTTYSTIDIITNLEHQTLQFYLDCINRLDLLLFVLCLVSGLLFTLIFTNTFKR